MNWQPSGFQPPGWQPAGWQPEGAGGGGGASAIISGTSLSDFTETKVVVGGETIIIDLSGDEWVADGATFNAIRQDIIDGITSAQSEDTGWNAEVRDKEDVSAVVRTSDARVTVTLSTAAAYAVSVSENITVTVPATAVVSAEAVVAAPDLTVVEDEDRGIASSRGRRPRIRKISLNSAALHIAGPEQPYPVYQFSNAVFVERRGHNPFKDL